jgi:hypothetical protein
MVKDHTDIGLVDDERYVEEVGPLTRLLARITTDEVDQKVGARH